MPKATTITKEIIINAAFELAREEGFGALSARSVSKRIGCSAQPIYWVYENMEMLKQDVIDRMERYLNDKLSAYNKTGKPFLDMGLAYIQLAHIEPIFFRAIYVDNIKRIKFTDIIPPDNLIEAVKNDDCVDEASHENSVQIAVNGLIFAHGIASLVAAGMMEYDEDRIEKMLLAMVG